MAGREITVLMIDGRAVTVKLRLLPRLMIHRYSLITVLLSFSVLFTLKPFNYLSTMPTWFSAPFLLMTIVAMLMLSIGALAFTGMYLGLSRVMTLPSTLASTVLVMFTTDYILNSVTVSVDPLMTWFEFVVKCIFTTIFVELVLFFYLKITYDKIEVEYDSPPVSADETPSAAQSVNQNLIDTGSGKIEISRVMYLEAQQSYVNIVSTSRSYLVRKTFSECLAEIPETMGRQIHRSYWVNREYVSEFQRVNQYRFQLVLKNGAILPVSRTRSTEIENWFREL